MGWGSLDQEVSAASLRLAAPGYFDLSGWGRARPRNCTRQVAGGVGGMLVGSDAETGDEWKAAAPPLPQMIGNVQTAAGSGPLKHATCTAAQTTAGDPRSRAHAGGFGMLWLTALTFSLMKEVQAADPNVTFLDDGNIPYKDLEHGAFELVTKEVIPRHFLVEDPGQTIALRPQGSSVSVSQSTNSAARMAELQAAQQEALATFEKGLGSTGSSTPPALEPLPVQPINFIQIDNSSPEQDLPAQPGSIFASVPETIFGKLPPPPPTPPTLNAIIGPTEIDTTVFDVFTATSGSFLASSSNSGATLTFGINGGTPGASVIDGVTYDVSKAGPYGTLYVDSTTGAYTFVPNNDAINALVAPTTTDFTITVSDRSEEHTSELQSQSNLVCRLLLEKKKKQNSTSVLQMRERWSGLLSPSTIGHAVNMRVHLHLFGICASGLNTDHSVPLMRSYTCR